MPTPPRRWQSPSSSSGQRPCSSLRSGKGSSNRMKHPTGILTSCTGRPATVSASLPGILNDVFRECYVYALAAVRGLFNAGAAAMGMENRDVNWNIAMFAGILVALVAVVALGAGLLNPPEIAAFMPILIGLCGIAMLFVADFFRQTSATGAGRSPAFSFSRSFVSSLSHHAARGLPCDLLYRADRGTACSPGSVLLPRGLRRGILTRRVRSSFITRSFCLPFPGAMAVGFASEPVTIFYEWSCWPGTGASHP